MSPRSATTSPATGLLDENRVEGLDDEVGLLGGEAERGADLQRVARSSGGADEDATLRPGGRLVFETRDPEYRAWERWTEETTRTTTNLPGVGPVTEWVQVTDVVDDGRFVTFESPNVFEADGTVITSRSTLRFRTRGEVEDSLRATGFAVDEVRDAPDRPGRELVFVARRST